MALCIYFEVRIPSKKAKNYYGFFLRKFSLVNDRRSAIVKNSNCNFRQNYMAMSSELRGNLIEPLFRTKTWERAPSKRFYDTVHNGGIYQFSFR